MTRTLLSSIAATAALAFAGQAFADDHATFESLDANGDGMVTADEIPAGHKMAEKFSSIDTDGNGQISRAEFDAWKMSRDEAKSDY
ncbi:MAG: hypothetical protein U0S76_00105 [Pseudoxanthomonas sp.]|nr:hypothetical protein [Pseudoxanthomonas sp.]